MNLITAKVGGGERGAFLNLLIENDISDENLQACDDGFILTDKPATRAVLNTHGFAFDHEREEVITDVPGIAPAGEMQEETPAPIDEPPAPQQTSNNDLERLATFVHELDRVIAKKIETIYKRIQALEKIETIPAGNT